MIHTPEANVVGLPVPRSVRSGAVSANAKFILDLRERNDLRGIAPADIATITSPKKGDGTHANLSILVNGSEERKVSLIAGGQSADIPGPIHSLVITPDAAVAGSGIDDIEILLVGRYRIATI